MKIKALVLAAGLASRMGKNKLLLAIDNTYIIEHLLSYIQKSKVTGISVVTGHRGEVIQEKLKKFHKVSFIYNPDYQMGMGTSIARGIKTINNEECDALLIFNGDMPFIKTETINCIIESYVQKRYFAVAPCYQGKRGHPVLFDKQAFPHLLKLDGDRGARDLIEKNKNNVLKIDTDDPGIHFDVDNEHDYCKALEFYKKIVKKGDG